MISVIVESFQVYSARLRWFFLDFTWPLRRFLLSRLAPTGKRIQSHVQMESNFEPKTQSWKLSFERSNNLSAESSTGRDAPRSLLLNRTETLATQAT